MFARVHRIDQPTLLLWGMRDRALTPSLADGIERFAPRLTVRRFYEATHWLHHEFPDEVNAEIIRFLPGDELIAGRGENRPPIADV
jgi:pimeloyl-ACP methyl ester carboxylesterase